jgi:xylan 1,4-beta-xylosidase
LMGSYRSDKVNPVLSHRQLGNDYPIQAVGHGDLVQTQNGEWWAVVLGKRVVNGDFSLTRETFLCKVQFENGTPIFNPGYGRVLMEQPRPNLPWTSIATDPARDEFNGDKLAIKWHFIRTPNERFYDFAKGRLKLALRPEVADSLVSPSMIVQKIKDYAFQAATKLSFSTQKDTEQAGLIIYRNTDGYVMLVKDKSGLVLIKKEKGKMEVVARVPYTQPEVYLKAVGHNADVVFSYGNSLGKMTGIGGTQSLRVIAESAVNRFNGPGIGVYASSNGKKTDNAAWFDWFEYSPENGK